MRIMRNRTFCKLIGLMLLPVAIAFVSVNISGCYSPTKATRHINKAQSHYPQIFAEKCAIALPVNSFIRDSFIYLQGEPVVFNDTLTRTDTFDQYITKYITKTVKVTDTVFKSVASTVESTAKLEAQRLKYEAELKKEREAKEAANTQATKYKTQRNITSSVLGVIALIIIARWVWKRFIKSSIGV